MKSIFLATLLCALASSSVFAQTQRKKKVPAPTSPRATQKSVMPVAPKKTVEKTHFDRFYDRLSISYFGVYMSPPLGYMHADYAAISPEFESKFTGCKNNCDTYSQNIFNQITFSYNFGGGKRFIIVPRWTIYLGNPRENGVPGKSEGSQLVDIEDTLVGWSLNLWNSEDKKWSWNLRPAVRLPTSRYSRSAEGGGAGDLTHQPDITTSVSYTMSPDWSFAYSLQNRFYVYEDRYNEYRHRVANSLSGNQRLTDTTALSYNVEYWFQNNRRRESLNGQQTSYKRMWFNTFLGYSWDVTSKLNVTPIVGAYPNDPNFGLRSAYVSAWFAYSIK